VWVGVCSVCCKVRSVFSVWLVRASRAGCAHPWGLLFLRVFYLSVLCCCCCCCVFFSFLLIARALFSLPLGTSEKGNGALSLHCFEPTTYFGPTWCSVCEQFIWGLRKQGYTCTRCLMDVHPGCRPGVASCTGKVTPKPFEKGAKPPSSMLLCGCISCSALVLL
jgi:Phorbol esters/diacylglycerol binding domain (C1 domain)